MLNPIILFVCGAVVLYYLLDNAAVRHEGHAPPV
jgi:hypothetical protein